MSAATESFLAPGDKAATSAPPPPPRPRGRRVGLIASLVTLGLLLAAWSLAAWQAWVSPLFLPSPIAVARAAAGLVTDGFADATLLQHFTASLGRVFGALAASLVVGVPVGFAIATSRIGRGILDPIVEFLRPLPPLAYLPLVIIWFGIGEGSKVLVIALAMVPPTVISTAAGVRAVSEDRIRAARSLGATGSQVLRFVVLPSALPAVLTGTRIALGTGWSTLVAAELVAATRGLGFMIQSAAQFLVTDVVIVGILVIASVAFFLESVIRFLERRFVPWSSRL
ncbi:ABC transporter permease subunit [Chthonobacter albigriseus]|uniref:ABC transporter permease subunit n=1 Tax=Chthonobacter albigriseus TaxID=1683161 RepID=UPI0015EF274F|nr:ABC transporter permease subunit [Chthonobacter albigriseus]